VKAYKSVPSFASGRKAKVLKLSTGVLLALLFACPSLRAQGGGVGTSGIVVISPTGRPVAGATVTVCNITDFGVPCTQTVSIFSDPALTSPLANPTKTDGLGNLIFYAAAGSYHYTITGSSITMPGQPYTAVVTSSTAANPAAPSTAVQINNGGSAFGADSLFVHNTSTHTLSVPNIVSSGSNNSLQINSALYVGGVLGSNWGSSDIGAQINAAYAALPSTGGTIVVTPQASGACYLYNTTITLNTIGKYVHLVGGASPQGTTGASGGGSCLQYTHVTATSAIVIDWDTTGNGTYISHQAIDNIVLMNSVTEGSSTPCTTVAGCGSLATGVMVPGVNGGIQMGEFRDMTIKGFGVGMNWSNGNGWGSMCSNCSFVENTTGLVLATGSEGLAFFGGNVSVNQTGVKIATGVSPTSVSFTGTHFDSNTLIAIDGSSSSTLGCGTVSLTSAHFENFQVSTSHYINCAGGLVAFHGVDAGDDSASGNTDWWFTVQNAIGDLEVISAGRSVTSLFVVGSSTALTIYDNNPAALITSSLGLCTATVNCADTVTSSVATAFSYLSQINQSTNSPFAQVNVCSGNTKVVTFAVAYIFGPPVIQLTDYSTAGGLTITAGPSKTGFTVHCVGAVDAFSWTAIGNPY
jgi:hypothetical protein